MSTFTGIGVSAPVQAIYPGSTIVTLTNTSAFHGLVVAEISLDGQTSWPVVPGSALTAGVMVAGPLSFSFAMNPSQWIRLHCLQYTSGTLTYSIAPASVAPGQYATDSAGLPSGTVYNNGGFLCVAP